MNVKISSEGVVFKISEDELYGLRDGQSVITSIFIGDAKFIVEISPCGDDILDGLRLCLDRSEACLVLGVSNEMITALLDKGRDRDGISLTAARTHIRLQVDVKTDTRPRKVV